MSTSRTHTKSTEIYLMFLTMWRKVHEQLLIYLLYIALQMASVGGVVDSDWIGKLRVRAGQDQSDILLSQKFITAHGLSVLGN